MPDAVLELQRAAADIPLTRDAREILEQASDAAAQRGAPQATPVDVLDAMFKRRSGLAVEAITSMGLDTRAIVAVMATEGAGAAALPLRQLLVNANREAQVLGHYQVDSIHLLLAMLYSDSPETSAPLQKAGLTLYDLRRHLQAGTKADFQPGESDRLQGSRSQPQGSRSSQAAQAPRARPDAALRRKPLPSMRGAFEVSPVFLGLVATTVLSGAILWFGLA